MFVQTCEVATMITGQLAKRVRRVVVGGGDERVRGVVSALIAIRVIVVVLVVMGMVMRVGDAVSHRMSVHQRPDVPGYEIEDEGQNAKHNHAGSVTPRRSSQQCLANRGHEPVQFTPT